MMGTCLDPRTHKWIDRQMDMQVDMWMDTAIEVSTGGKEDGTGRVG